MKIFTKLSFLFILIVYSCVDLPSDYELPSWDVDLNIPLTERSYTLEEIVELDSNITIEKSGDEYIYALKSEEYKKTLYLSEFLEGQLNGKYDSEFKFQITSIDTSISVELLSGAEIDSAYLTRGSLTLNASNESDSPVRFILTFSELTDSNGDPLVVDVNLIGGQLNKEVVRDLSNYSYSSTALNRKNLLISAEMISDNPTTDNIVFTFEFADSEFSYIKGKIPSKRLEDMNEIANLPLTDDVLELRDKIFLGDATLELLAEYKSEYDEIFELVFDSLQLTGRRNTNIDFSLTDLNNNSNLGEVKISDGIFYRKYDKSNSNISEFLSFMPDNIIIQSPIFMNPNGSDGIATDQDKIDITVKFSAKSGVRIDTINYTFYEDFELNEDTTYVENIKNAVLTYLIQNTIPTKELIRLDFLDQDSTELFSKSLEIAGGLITESGKMNLTPTETEKEFEMNEEEISLLLKTKIIKTNLILMTTDKEKYAAFGPKQWVNIKAYATITYNVQDL